MEKSGGKHFDRAGPSNSDSKRTRLSRKDGPAEDAIKEANQEEKINPFDIPKVVATVVGHLNDFGDLKNVRTQSTVWRDETLQKWRDSAVLLITVETFPILVKAFEESDLAHFAGGGNDPFKLKQVPFKKYRFDGNRGEQLWSYPLSETDFEGRVLWDKVIAPHATYLDVGPCSLKKFTGGGPDVHYQPALRWIMKRCPNVTDLAMAPFRSLEEVDTLSDSEEEDETEELIKGHDYLFVPGGDLWKLKRFNAPKINSFTLSTPQQTFLSGPSTGNKKLKGLFERGLTSNPFGDFLLGGMMNLKHLQLPTEGRATALFRGVTPFGTEKQIYLESLTAFASGQDHYLDPLKLENYLETVCPPLRELRASLYFTMVYENDMIGLRLDSVQKTLEKLELEIKIHTEAGSVSRSSSVRIPEVKLYFGNFSLKKLTHLKITVDCYTTPRLLGTFDLNRLMRLPALEEFYFGIMNPVDKTWLTRKLQFFELGSRSSAKLDNLKSFHFYGNLAKETLDKLGQMAGNLETLEVVLDAENCSVVQDNWPRLKNLKLLEGSDVSDEFLSTLKSKPTLVSLEKL